MLPTSCTPAAHSPPPSHRNGSVAAAALGLWALFVPTPALAGPLWGSAGTPRWWAAVAGLAVGTGLAILQIRRRAR